MRVTPPSKAAEITASRSLLKREVSIWAWLSTSKQRVLSSWQKGRGTTVAFSFLFAALFSIANAGRGCQISWLDLHNHLTARRNYFTFPLFLLQIERSN